MAANDRQVGGSHYQTGGMQHWDFVEHFRMDYFQGQITKYLLRWRKKNGIEDLEKARHYLDKYIEIQRGKAELKKHTESSDTPEGGGKAFSSHEKLVVR